MTKKVSRVHNWRKYNEALVHRGRINFWFDLEPIKNLTGPGCELGVEVPRSTMI